MSADPPYLLARAIVESSERVSPTFARITFGGDDLSLLGTPGASYDQRIKLIFPGDSGVLPEFDATDDWYRAWLDLPEADRGSMRTYSVRDLVVEGPSTRLVIDFVLHVEPGASGPASRWADSAVPGDEVLIVGPRRGRTDGGGIEYSPGVARSILLAGDETAAPAIARILEDADRDLQGVAFIEVPSEGDVLHIGAPEGVDVHWLPRASKAPGTALIPAVLGYLGEPVPVSIADVETEDPLWETPTYSGLGEDLGDAQPHADRYFWIAGESATVTTLRRQLVRDHGIDRSQVAFMGYWRKGVAMRG
jgi:NADPH-dependent ferric siderophore reductase